MRRLVSHDAQAFRALRLQCLRDHPEAFTSDHDSEAAKPLSATVDRINAQALFGAFDGEQMVGMIGLDRETRPQNRHKAHVVAVYVAPSHLGRGVAQQLVHTVIDHARQQGVQRLVLTVTHGNDRAQALYERLGFAVFGIEPDAILVKGILYAKVHMGRAI